MINVMFQRIWLLYLSFWRRKNKWVDSCIFTFWKNTYCTFPLSWNATNDQCHVTKELVVAKSCSVKKLHATWYTLALYYTMLHNTAFHWTLLHTYLHWNFDMFSKEKCATLYFRTGHLLNLQKRRNKWKVAPGIGCSALDTLNSQDKNCQSLFLDV